MAVAPPFWFPLQDPAVRAWLANGADAYEHPLVELFPSATLFGPTPNFDVHITFRAPNGAAFRARVRNELEGSLLAPAPSVDRWLDLHQHAGDAAWLKNFLTQVPAAHVELAFVDETQQPPFFARVVRKDENGMLVRVLNHPNRAPVPGLATLLKLDARAGTVFADGRATTAFGDVFVLKQ
jgi:hypothetical protein